MRHIPVLAKEIVDGLALHAGMTVLDGTLGLGGHAALLREAISPGGTLVGFDRDERNLATARERLGVIDAMYVNDSFANIDAHNVPMFDAALLDLGFSSVHVDDASRGFSFMHNGPLDMRYDTRQQLTAAIIVNTYSVDDIATLLRTLGEEPNAARIAQAIADRRRTTPFATTLDLASLIATIIPRRGKIHPATHTFQALRIAVNDELGELSRGLDAIVRKLKPDGRFAVITFHSLEDRIVKNFFKNSAQWSLVTKKPIVATDEELRTNPRARSAKLRIAAKV